MQHPVNVFGIAGVYEIQLNSVFRLGPHNIFYICSGFRILCVCVKPETILILNMPIKLTCLEYNMLFLPSMIFF